MDGPSKPLLIVVFSGAALFIGVGVYLVFTGYMTSYSFMMIGVTIGVIGALVGRARR